MTLLAKSVGDVAAPALTTWSMFLVLAEAKTSAGAPAVICVARPELGPKWQTTRVPGWAASNWAPSLVNASLREAAANTLMVPDSAGVPDTDAEGEAGDTLVVEEPHPASRSPAVAATVMVRVLRRILLLQGSGWMGVASCASPDVREPVRGSAMGGHFHDHVGGLHRCDRQDAGFELELVSRLTAHQGHDAVGARLDLNLRHDRVADHSGDQPDEPVAGRLRGHGLRLCPLGGCGQVGGKPGQDRALDAQSA